ncbi:hypothetical protein [Lysobacter capsici]
MRDAGLSGAGLSGARLRGARFRNGVAVLCHALP